MLLQASNDDQLSFQESFLGNQSKENRPIAGTEGLKLCIPRALVHEAAIPKTAYNDTPNSVATLLWEAQQKDALVDTQRCLLANEADGSPGPHVASNWAILDGILRYKSRIYVPKSASIQAEILLQNHDDPHAGHFETHKTLELFQRKYFWPRMAEDVKDTSKTARLATAQRQHVTSLMGSCSCFLLQVDHRKTLLWTSLLACPQVLE